MTEDEERALRALWQKILPEITKGEIDNLIAWEKRIRQREREAEEAREKAK